MRDAARRPRRTAAGLPTISEPGCVQEASLLTQLWTEAQAFGRDEDTICEYLIEYLRKWAGRGIPIPVDVLLAQRVSGNRLQSSGATPEAVKALSDTVKSLKQMMDAAKSEIGNLKSELGRIRNQAPGAGAKPRRLLAQRRAPHGTTHAQAPVTRHETQTADARLSLV